MAEKALNRYAKLIEYIFLGGYKEGASEVLFKKDDLEDAARDLGIKLPKNLSDLIYSFRYRVVLPESVQTKARPGQEWIIRPAGRGLYRFVGTIKGGANILPDPMLPETKVPDATPGLITMYALSDEQALLAKVRYNRLMDLFSGAVCYSLQSHLRTQVKHGQVETDEIYVGVDRKGAHYAFPVQAKAGTDKLSVVQIEQDFAMCAFKFPKLVCRPVATQFMADDLIAMFEFEQDNTGGVRKSTERHYRLVPPDQMTPADIDAYRARPDD